VEIEYIEKPGALALKMAGLRSPSGLLTLQLNAKSMLSQIATTFSTMKNKSLIPTKIKQSEIPRRSSTPNNEHQTQNDKQ
jgi:hypothetical protein